MKKVSFSMKGPFFGHHPQFYIGKFQELPQGIGLGKIQVLRGQDLAHSLSIFDEASFRQAMPLLVRKATENRKESQT